MQPFRAIAAALLLLFAVGSSACGTEIGDECSLSTDCSSAGDRFCDINSPGGYCTVIGCDFDTCPDEAICVRFFSVANSNHRCDANGVDRPGEYDCLADQDDDDTNDQCCTADELCTLGGSCVPRTAESRYCMKTCSTNGDCRDGYECRDKARMMEHGGEPVPPPGEAVSDDPQPFCAAAPLE